MNGGNKLKRLPAAPEEEDAREFRRRRQELDRMAKQNQETRQLITKLRQTTSAGGKKLGGEVERLQVDLKELMFKLDVESKKNKVLKELIELTNRGLMESKKEGRVDNGHEYSVREKQLKKEEYDIEQVLQKHNEEIAKINVLKEQVSFSRRERVVYSNLFKKIEKEIKVYEERFKETLLHTFETESKKRQLAEDMVMKRKISERTNSARNNAHRLSNASLNAQGRTQTTQAKKFTQLVDPSNKSASEDHDHIFITFASPVNKSRQDSVATQNKRSNKVEKINEELEKYRSFFNALRVHLKTKDCSIEDMVSEIVGVEDENDRLTQQIDATNELIGRYTSRLGEAERQLGRVDIFKKRYKQADNAEQLVREERERLESDLLLMKQLYRLLSVEPLEDCEHLSVDNSNQSFRMIEEKVNQLSKLLPERRGDGETNRKQGQTESTETQIEGLMERLDRYNESEKILTRQAFYEESSKELFKLRKVRPRNLNSNR